MIKHLIDATKEYSKLQLKYYNNCYVNNEKYNIIPFGRLRLIVTRLGNYDIITFGNTTLCFCGNDIHCI